MLHRAYEQSVLLTVLSWVQTHLHAAVDGSRAIALVRRGLGQHNEDTASAGAADEAGSVSATFRAAGANSTLAWWIRTAKRYTTASWLYRWLTAEPDPDIIVIDLSDTWTVGPILTVLERILHWLTAATAASVAVRIARRIHSMATARPVQLGSLVVGGTVVSFSVTRVATGTPSIGFLVLVAVVLLLSLAGSQVTWTWDELQDTRGYRAIVAAFEPPEPPERASDADSGAEQTADSDRGKAE